MWQFLLFSAVAGLFSNRLRAAKDAGGTTGKGNGTTEQQCREELETGVGSVEPQVSSPTALLSPMVRIDEYVQREEGGFRFSSRGSRFDAENLGEKGGDSGKTVRPEQRFGVEKKKGARRFGLRLKSRRIGMDLAADKRGSCMFKGGCSFGWGLGVGMMCMISTRKSEISKLNSAMEEAAKSLKDLKAELDKRRSSNNTLIRSSSTNEVKTNTPKCDSEPNKEHNDIKFSSFLDDGYSPSSALTEEQDQDLIEIDQLEAEFVLELQKLPCCSEEASQFHGVNPSELEQKLSLLLIEQQENQIMELKCELGMARWKLNEKEDELRALKGRLRRLTELSLSTVTDDETEAHEGSDNWDYNNIMGSEFELCGY